MSHSTAILSASALSGAFRLLIVVNRPTACADWWKAFHADNEKSGIMPGPATLGTPWNVDVTGDRAYFVAPMTYT
jgi:hypothetical protein